MTSFVSIVSAWEIALKQSVGKRELPKPAEQWLPEVLRRNNFELAEVGLLAALRVRALPWHHRDPFDRLLSPKRPKDTRSSRVTARSRHTEFRYSERESSCRLWHRNSNSSIHPGSAKEQTESRLLCVVVGAG